jgi:hypothetical protein
LFDVRFYDAIVDPTSTTYKQLLTSPSTESNLQLNLFRGYDGDRWTKNSGSVQDASTNGNDLSITNQAAADTPVEADVWPGPGRGGVTLEAGETTADGYLIDDGPSRSGVVYTSLPFMAYSAFLLSGADHSVYSSMPFMAYSGSLVIEPGGGGPGLEYRMRGYDTTLTSIVFWASDHVDSTASDYGGPGPVTGIVVHDVIGA